MEPNLSSPKFRINHWVDTNSKNAIKYIKYTNNPNKSTGNGSKSKQNSKTGAIYVCKVCEQEFKSIREFEDHAVTAHTSIPPKNENVPFQFNETAKLYVCNICLKGFKSINGFQNHALKAHVSDTTSKNENIPAKSEVKNHLGMHNIILTARTEVKNHEHQNTKKSVAEESDAEMQEFSCDICKKEFSQMPLLEAHIINEHLKKMSSSSVSSESEIESEVETDQEVETPFRDDTNSKKIESNLMDDDVLKKECLTRRLVIKLKRIGNAQNQSEHRTFEEESLVTNSSNPAIDENLKSRVKLEPSEYVFDHHQDFQSSIKEEVLKEDTISEDSTFLSQDLVSNEEVVELKFVQPTKLKIKVDNGTFKMYTMPNHCETVTLKDVKKFLLKESSFPKKSGNTFEFFVKIIDDGDTTFEKCTLSSAILPNIIGKITLECHTIK